MHKSGNIYADLASFYDQFCAEVDYLEQCAFAHRVFQSFAATDGREYFDLACGTGQHLLQMQVYGYTPSGLDNSSAMLALAAERCPAATLELCDLAEFAHQQQFDLITCFLYSIHYAHPVSSVAETLHRSFAALKPGGVLVFNAVDASGIKNDEGITTHLDDGEQKLSFQSGWTYSGAGEVLNLNLRIARQFEGTKEEWRDHHVMTALHFDKVQSLLEQAGFEVTMMEHDYSVMRPFDGSGFNAIFVACKPKT